MDMEEMCLVMCGGWYCGNDGKWEFLVDKKRMARMFGACNRIKTPPVVLTNDGALRYFFTHLKVRGSMNLFATLERVGGDLFQGSGSVGVAFETPMMAKEKKNVGGGYSGNGEYVSSVGSKTNFINLEDVELVEEVERFEARAKSASKSTGAADLSGCSEGLESDLSGYSGPEEVDDRDVRPKGYDYHFWEPLIAGDLGGTDALETVFNGKDEAGSVKMEDGRRGNSSNTGGSSRGLQGDGASCGWDGEDVMGGVHLDDLSWMGQTRLGGCVKRGQNSGGIRSVKRNLRDVDDDEFDIPPLYDDTEYEAAEIPGLDIEGADGVVHVGKVYGSKVDCQIALAIYAIKNQIRYTQTRTEVDSFVCECPEERCDWRVTAHEIRGTGYYEIRKAQLVHSCPIETRNGYMKRGTARVIAAVYKSKFKEPTKGPKVGELQRLVLEDLRISASYMKCYRAKEQAVFDLRGPDDDSYTKLGEYLYMLKLANPGTIADIESEVDKEGVERFVYMFLAFGASIRGFKKLRLVLVVDGTHLSGKYKGVLLTASGQDGNFQVFPLAFAVVDAEDTDAWTWFLQKLERILADSPSVTIISDRATSIASAVCRVYPQAHHVYCIVHLARNVNAKYSCKGLARLVTAAACAHRMRDYRNYCDKIRAANSDCAIYLGKIGTSRWSRTHCTGERYNIMTSNIAEQLNNALVEGRSSPIVELVMFIQEMMTRWFSARRKKSERHRGVMTVEVDKVMTKSMAMITGSKINSVSSWSSQVVGKFGGRDSVMLDQKKCTCKYFDHMKIPCGHAMLAADNLGVPYGTLVGHWYKTETWKETYAGVISPIGDPRDEDIPEDVRKKVLMPPVTKRPAGRRKTKRYLSTGEIPGPNKKEKQNRCGRCRGIGHNRTNCTVPLD
ncbi:uncharacterized protein LOC130510422 [Raphanus sativus]|uniref:Uncharacterized protein LOC130510422 n=1 Tax=Raphanus sativus TaxID=3726 RepID=A0A9W3DFU4_RAPSA|nr:uncharacterized protein LOC130510422 [Raphanus sativus]